MNVLWDYVSVMGMAADGNHKPISIDFYRYFAAKIVVTENIVITKKRDKMTEEIRFEDLPRVIKTMMTKVEELCAKMDKIIPSEKEPIDRWFTVDELREYLPEHPARQTVYGWTSNAIIPHHKKGKNLRFRKSEVDKWLHEGYNPYIKEIEEEAKAFIEKKRKPLF